VTKPQHDAPDYARAVAFAREARPAATRSRPVSLAALGVAVLGLAIAGICAVSSGLVHARGSDASLGSAADVLTANPPEDLDMRALALGVVAMAVTPSAFSNETIPAGWMVIADSEAQWSSVQGDEGWSYLFDTGPGTAAQLMPYFTTNPVYKDVWCTRPGSGYDGSFCFLGRTGGHPSTPACDSATGLERPIRRWNTAHAIPCRILLQSEANPLTSGIRIDLLVDGDLALSRTMAIGNAGVVQQEAEAVISRQIEIVVDPLGQCGNDGFWTLLKVLTPDCNANLIADAVEIANGSVADINSDEVPDTCQCLGDVIPNGLVDGADLSALLSVWGTSGGLYPRADCNSDGLVDAQDLAIVLSGWGACP
jgi:hypothetical protein